MTNNNGNKTFSENLTEEILRIEKLFINKAIIERDTAYWETLFRITEDKIIPEKCENIYSGVGGIILMLKELYLLNKNSEILKLLDMACNWIIDYSKSYPTTYYSFITGRLGVAFVLHEAYKISPQKKYLAYSQEICKESVKFFKEDNYCFDYINGMSGALLCLTYLYKETSEDYLLDIIIQFAENLVSNIKFHKHGIFWDENLNAKMPLCGLAHGNSGIGLILIEVGNFFRNKALTEIGKSALKYENHFYNPKQENWEDLRLVELFDKNPEFINQLIKNNNLTLFNTTHYMSAWCHGAIGIGLARLNLFSSSLNKSYLKEIYNVISLTESLLTNSTYYTSTICHGSLGNSLFLLHAYNILNKKKYLQNAQAFCNSSIQEFRKKGFYQSGFMSSGSKEDMSLFNGVAGICYHYINVLNENNTSTNNIFHLSFKKETGPEKACKIFNKHFSKEKITNTLIKKYYPKTCLMLNSALLKKVIGINKGVTSSINNFNKNILSLTSKTDYKIKNTTIVELILEHEMFKSRLLINNFCLLFNIENYIKNETKNYDFNSKNFNRKSFTLFPGLKIINLKNKKLKVKKLPAEYYIIVPYTSKTQMFKLNELQYFILKHFKESNSIDDMVAEMSSKNPEIIEQYLKIIEMQSIEFVKAGLLIESKLNIRPATE
jgi:hypothetical protein